MDSGLSFDASSEAHGGEDLDRAVGSGGLKGGSGSVLREGMKRAGPQRERDGGDSFLATADGIRQQHRTAFCALKHTRSSYKAAIYCVDTDCRSMLLRKCRSNLRACALENSESYDIVLRPRELPRTW